MKMEQWQVIENLHPGYFGSEKDKMQQQFDEQYGEGKWRMRWRLTNGETQDYLRQFYENYVGGYVLHFLDHQDEALEITRNYAYSYDKNLISKVEAFDPNAYFNRLGFDNQIHHAALNIALERFLDIPFRGDKPIQVRSGKRETPQESWPAGWR